MKKKDNKLEFKYDFEKSVYWSIQSIENLQTESAFKTKLKGFPIDNSIATSIKNPKGGFIVKFFLDKIYDSSYFKDNKYGTKENILLDRSGRIYSINENSVTKITVSLSLPQVLTIEVKNLQSAVNKEFDNKVQRLIIPIKEDVSFEAFQCRSIHISGTTTFCGLVEVKVKNKSYHLFKYSNKDAKKNYLLIDSLEENTFDEFKNNTSSILLGFGLITGNLYQDEYFYQVIREDNVTLADATAYEKKEASIIIPNGNLFNPREFKNYIESFKKGDILKQIPIFIQPESFSQICNKINENKTLARCIKLLLEGNQTKSLLLRAGIYSIALETVTNIIYEENEEKINPIPDKGLAKKIRDKLKTELNEYGSFLSEYGHKVLIAKLDDLNKPTNSKKLSKPFEIYNLPLSKSDLDILNHRNKFLHGTSPFKEEELDEKQKDVKYISSKLRFLINCLVLKYCGYSGHILNFGAVHQLNWEKTMTEPLFKII